MQPFNIPNIVSQTTGNIYNLSPLGSISIGGFQLAQISDYVASASAKVTPLFSVLQTLGMILSAIFITLMIILIRKMRALNTPAVPEAQVSSYPSEAVAVPVTPGGWMTARWGEVMRHMDSAKEAEWKFAIIESDKLVEEVLRRAGYPGETLGERLANIQPGTLESFEGLSAAHKVRNRIAHDLNYFLRYTEAKHVIQGYANTLKELGAL